MTAPAFLTVQEFATALRISRSMAYELVWTHQVRSIQVGRAIRVPRSELARLAEEGTGGGTRTAQLHSVGAVVPYHGRPGHRPTITRSSIRGRGR